MGAVTALAGCSGGSGATTDTASSTDVVRIGVLEDQSGNFALVGDPKHKASLLAIEEINANGGIDGKEIEVYDRDPQSDNQRYQELTREMIEEHEVDVLWAGYSSATREAIRPIVDRNEQLYFYTTQYEGGVCDEFTFAVGPTARQQLGTVLPYLREEYGPEIYTFGVLSINFATPGGITAAVIAGIAVGGLSAGLLGYFMFYGGVRDVYVTIITLVTTMVLHTFMAQTAGSEWTIGEAALGGFNGMPDIPLLSLGIGDATLQFVFNEVAFALPGLGTVAFDPFYYLAVVALLGAYLGLRALVNSDYGRVMVAVREDEDRTRMFGYDVRRVKLVVFTIGGALAGLSGVLYAARNVFIDPTVFSLLFATLPVIWVSLGGRKSLLGAVVATVGVEYVRVSVEGEFALVALGALLVTTILALPGGVVPWLHETLRTRTNPADVEGRDAPDSSPEVTDP